MQRDVKGHTWCTPTLCTFPRCTADPMHAVWLQVMFMEEASRRYGPKGLSVNAFSPGFIPAEKGFFRYQEPPRRRAWCTPTPRTSHHKVHC